MEQNFDHLSGDEKLKAENDFLKMKMMLEQGAQFGSMASNDLPAEIENQFLKNVMAFEEKFKGERKVIKLSERIGQPKHFEPVSAIPDHDIASAWEELDNYLQQYDICLSVSSPKVTERELYRFTTEELFNYEMDDQHLPGWTTHFTYDEFYPDHEFENTNAAVTNCIEEILSVTPLEWMMNFKSEGLQLNQHTALTEDEFKIKVNLFKAAYDDVTDAIVNVESCLFNEHICTVSGNYSLNALYQNNNAFLSGNWKVDFEKDNDLGYWNIFSVTIDGINF